jgi:hypothetical protein
MGQGTLLFVDEIHRFNRAQQDGFLPVMEDGTITLVGATTENPSFALNAALLSRARVLTFRSLDEPAIDRLLARAEASEARVLPLTDAARVALVRMALPERQAHPAVYVAFALLTESFSDNDLWPPLYARFELGLLAAAGYGLDLTHCALSGVESDLAYVSPKSGRAASREAGAPFADKLLILPTFLTDPEADLNPNDLADGFALSGFFLERRIFDHKGEGMPPARIRLIEALGRTGRL